MDRRGRSQRRRKAQPSILRRAASVNCGDMEVSIESTGGSRELRWQRGVELSLRPYGRCILPRGRSFVCSGFRRKEIIMEEQKKNMLSLIQPTNTPHLGNYLALCELGKATERLQLLFRHCRPALHHRKAGPREAPQPDQGELRAAHRCGS